VVIPPRSRLTTRLREHLAAVIAGSNRAVSQVAAEHGAINEDPGVIPGHGHITGVSFCSSSESSPTSGVSRRVVVIARGCPFGYLLGSAAFVVDVPCSCTQAVP